MTSHEPPHDATMSCEATRRESDPLDLADAIAARLTDPDTVATRDNAQSLAGGAAGIALLHIERARTGRGDWATAHSWLTAAVRDELIATPAASLFFGAPALAFVVRAAADRPGRYDQPLAALDTSTINVTRRRLQAAHARIDRGECPAPAEYDLITGLAGLGAYHLLAHPGHAVTGQVLAYLVRLTDPPPGRDDDRPGWWTEFGPHGGPSPEFPGGHGNLGIAHGIAGPLALLASAMRRDVTVPGHTDAIKRICRWLDMWQQQWHPAAASGTTGPWWPGFITTDHLRTGQVEPASRQRPSWCYGTPGLARAQQLAGIATGDTERQDLAELALLSCLRDHTHLESLDEMGLCHGVAGLVQTTVRMAADARHPGIAAEIPRLTAKLVTRVRAAPNNPDFLDGAVGAALTLQFVTTDPFADPAIETTWDTCLLLP